MKTNEQKTRALMHVKIKCFLLNTVLHDLLHIHTVKRGGPFDACAVRTKVR